MQVNDDEERSLRLVALQNAQSIHLARQGAERSLAHMMERPDDDVKNELIEGSLALPNPTSAPPVRPSASSGWRVYSSPSEDPKAKPAEKMTLGGKK